MKILSSVLIFLFLMAGCTSKTVKRDPYTGYVPNPLPLNHAIIRLHDSNDEFFCTGFVIDDNYALTAAHCVDDKTDINVYNGLKIDTEIKGKVIDRNEQRDIALIKGDFSTFARYPIIYDTIDVSSDVYILCGFPHGQNSMLCVAGGFVRNYQWHYMMSSMLFPGMSGGLFLILELGLL